MIQITDNARERLISILIEEDKKAIRFGLQGGGCSGFSYYFGLEDEINDDDLEIQLDTTHIMIVDSISSMYLDGSQVDYKSDVMGDNFVFNNPNSTTTCGCGNSTSFG